MSAEITLPNPADATDVEVTAAINTHRTSQVHVVAQPPIIGPGYAASYSDSRLSDQRVPTDGSVTNTKVATGAAIDQSKINGLVSDLANKVDTTDARLSDQRVPTDGSVTNAKVASNAAIAQSKIAGLESALTQLSIDITNAQSAANAYTDLKLDQRDIKQSVYTLSDSNVSLTTPGTDIGGVTLSTAKRIALTGQTNAAENGLYDWTGASTALTRTSDANTSAEVTSAMMFAVEAGQYGNSWWYLQTQDPITLGTTNLTFASYEGSSTRYIDLRHPKYGLISNDSSAGAVAANDAGIAEIIAEAKASFKPVLLTTGTFYISQTIVLDANFITFWGMGNHTNFIQTTTNPVMTVGVSSSAGVARCNIGGFRLSYSSLQTSSSAIGLKLQNVWMNRFERISVENAYDAVKGVDNTFVFSNTFDDIFIKPWKNDGFTLKTSGLAHTGNVFGNIYISCGDNTSVGTVTGVPFALRQTAEQTIRQLNIEWVKCAVAMEFDTARPVKIDSLHVEGVSLTANHKGVLHAMSNAVVEIDSWNIQDLSCLIADGADTRNGLVSVVGGSLVEVRGIHYENQAATVNCPQFSWVLSDTASPGSQNCKVRWGNVSYNFTNSGITHMDRTVVDTAGFLKRHTTAEWDQVPGLTPASAVTFGNADATLSPTANAQVNVFTTALTAERTVTLSEGSSFKQPPGTKFFVVRSTAATGNFDLVVKSLAGTELARLGIGDWGFFELQYDSTWRKFAGGNLNSLDSDLVAIAALSPTNDDILQRKSGAWTNRTPAQFKTDLALTKSDVGLANVDNTSDANKPVSSATQTALNAKADLVGGFVPSNQLPSYVDDVLEYADFGSFPGTGESGKIYVAADTNLTYRWTGSAYAGMSSALALGETSTTAYRGDRGKTAYDHSQLITGNPHAVTKSDVGLGNADNTSDANKPVSTATQSALDAKVDKSTYDANSILYATTDNTPVALTVAASTVVGRDSSGGIAALTMTQLKTLLALAISDVASLQSALDAKLSLSTYDANSILYATTDNTPAALTVGSSTFVGRKATGDISAMSVSEVKTLLALAIADVTNLQTTLDAKLPKAPVVTTLTVAGSTYTPNCDTSEIVQILNPAADFTVAAPTGTPANGQKLTVWIQSDATGRTPTWNAIYLASGVASMPTTALPASKWVTLFFVYNSTVSKWVNFSTDSVGY